MTERLSVREAGSGTPLVLLHAFPLSARMWESQLDELPGSDGSDARVLAVDLRGFGGTALGTDDPSLDLLADDIALLLDAAGIDQAVLGGLSMGGYVAMAFARRYPQRLSGLLLADTKGTADTDAARENRERVAKAVLARNSVRLLVDEQLPAPLLGATTARRCPKLVDHVAGLIGEAAPESVAWAQRAMAARPDSLASLRAVDVPALVVVGDEDTLTPPSDAEALAAALPQAELTILPGAGHLSALEVPEAFNTAVRGLLARID
ncbi:pimeloyl-ACP methyl ester carboxylesterase [Streptacidiphilus sp. MAP12-33]|uniref:alpha/beta fold hydrolase n=1 Tax=Streptacidiphilus sp. MAP12-33 TaxID=3156266 RepID=UPI003511D7D5